MPAAIVDHVRRAGDGAAAEPPPESMPGFEAVYRLLRAEFGSTSPTTSRAP